MSTASLRAAREAILAVIVELLLRGVEPPLALAQAARELELAIEAEEQRPTLH
jgi:hypothetical protein